MVINDKKIISKDLNQTSDNHRSPNSNNYENSTQKATCNQLNLFSISNYFNKNINFSNNSNWQSLKQLNESNSQDNRLCNDTSRELNDIYKKIDQSYSKLPILYHSIRKIKLETDFIVSVNDYFDRLKANVYKDLVRRETILRNGKNHTKNLASFIRCVCKTAYEQANENVNSDNLIQHTILYTMTAIDYILQNNFPQKKPLFNYILIEYISMWLHENLRMIQEDFSIIIEHGTNNTFFKLCRCLFHKLESACAINWERLQMIQNYRLTHFHELMKSSSTRLEKNADFILLFGDQFKPSVNISELALTLLYSHRTNNEMDNINQIHGIFRRSIAKVLLENDFNRLSEKESDTREINIQTEEIKYLPTNIQHQQQTPTTIDVLSKKNSSPELYETDIHQLATNTCVSLAYSQVNQINNQDDAFLPSNAIGLTDNSHDSILTPMCSQSLGEEVQKYSHEKFETRNYSFVCKSNDSLSINLLPKYCLKQNEPLTLTYISQLTSFVNEVDSNVTNETSLNKSTLDRELAELIQFLTEFVNSTSPLRTDEKEFSLTKQVKLKLKLQCFIKQSSIDPKSIAEQAQTDNPDLTLTANDPLFLAAFIRALRKELTDAQTLRKIDHGEREDDLSNINRLSFEIQNALKLPNHKTAKSNTKDSGNQIDRSCTRVEVIHDPSRCSPNNSAISHYQCQSFAPAQNENTICKHTSKQF